MLTNDKKILGILSTIILAGGMTSGCVAYAQPSEVGIELTAPVIAVGYYDPAFGYWTGTEWDYHFYEVGHTGYGHPHYVGPRYVERGHERDHFDQHVHHTEH